MFVRQDTNNDNARPTFKREQHRSRSMMGSYDEIIEREREREKQKKSEVSLRRALKSDCRRVL